MAGGQKGPTCGLAGKIDIPSKSERLPPLLQSLPYQPLFYSTFQLYPIFTLHPQTPHFDTVKNSKWLPCSCNSLAGEPSLVPQSYSSDPSIPLDDIVSSFNARFEALELPQSTLPEEAL